MTPAYPEHQVAALLSQLRQELALLKDLSRTFGAHRMTRDLAQKRLLEINRHLKRLWRKLR